MSTQTDDIVVREVGEQVTIKMTFEPDSVKDLGDGVFEATVTTAETDRTNESIDTQGLDATSWEKTGMPVLYGHDYSALPIGKGLSFKQFKQKFTSKFQLAVKEYPFAATVAALIKGGYLNAVSIGGVVRQWSEDYSTIEKMEMVEFSVVPVPANASALITSRSLEQLTGKNVGQIRDEYQEFATKYLTERVKNIDNAELIAHIKTLKSLTAILENAASAKTSEKAISDSDEPIKLTLKKTAGKISATSQEIIRITRKV